MFCGRESGIRSSSLQVQAYLVVPHSALSPAKEKDTHTHTHEGDVIYWFLSGTHYTDSSQCPASLKGFMTNNIAIEGWVNKMVLTPFTEKAPEQS